MFGYFVNNFVFRVGDRVSENEVKKLFFENIEIFWVVVMLFTVYMFGI